MASIIYKRYRAVQLPELIEEAPMEEDENCEFFAGVDNRPETSASSPSLNLVKSWITKDGDKPAMFPWAACHGWRLRTAKVLNGRHEPEKLFAVFGCRVCIKAVEGKAAGVHVSAYSKRVHQGGGANILSANQLTGHTKTEGHRVAEELYGSKATQPRLPEAIASVAAGVALTSLNTLAVRLHIKVAHAVRFM